MIYNAIDISSKEFNEDKRLLVRDKLNIKDRFVIGTVGRMTYQKNQSFLLDLVAQLKDIDPVLIIVGTGEDEAALRKQAKQLEIEDSVKFVGAQKDIQAWLSAFDVFAFPSHYEGLSVALLEAEANGVPIVASEKAVDKLAKINNNIFICDGVDEWKKSMTNIYEKNLRMTSEEVEDNFKSTQFDICNEAKKLQKFFLS